MHEHIDPVLPVGQLGLRKNDGSVLQLTQIVHRLAKALDNKNAIASYYSDLGKAIDRVWHNGLHELAHFGIGYRLLNWFREYLNCCLQGVKVNTVTSKWKIMPAGVPQESVSGTLLFLTYTAYLC